MTVHLRHVLYCQKVAESSFDMVDHQDANLRKKREKVHVVERRKGEVINRPNNITMISFNNMAAAPYLIHTVTSLQMMYHLKSNLRYLLLINDHTYFLSKQSLGFTLWQVAQVHTQNIVSVKFQTVHHCL